MIKCPGCGATLPPSYVRCQFCGSDLSKVPRPVVQNVKRGYEPEKWITVSYLVVSWYFVVSGIYDLVTGLIRGHPLPVCLGALDILLGIGLLTKFNLARGIVNVLCFLQIIFGLLGLVASVFSSAIIGFLGFLLVLYSLFRIATAGFMIFLLSETDKHPNF